VVKEVVWKKLVTLQGLLLHLPLPGLTVCGAPAPEPAPAVVTKEYEWSLGGITEDTYVTLTYTNPDGTTGGLSDYYYGALGSQYILCQKHSYSEPWYHNQWENAQEHQPLHLHQHQHQHLSLSLSLHQLLEEH
jgi:hypothetical protein